jgi:hypothetical protein
MGQLDDRQINPQDLYERLNSDGNLIQEPPVRRDLFTKLCADGTSYMVLSYRQGRYVRARHGGPFDGHGMTPEQLESLLKDHAGRRVLFVVEEKGSGDLLMQWADVLAGLRDWAYLTRTDDPRFIFRLGAYAKRDDLPSSANEELETLGLKQRDGQMALTGADERE